ncbi:hypothetical protein BaRGS_00001335 [Batillaria attramentaria]|uniref:Uncharacterized protein n=1 Tax=Batillaria attramentaria TaxID=370345 RepID=A0ABD0M6Q1_9CAEN
MVAILRLVGGGVFIVAVLLHVIGYATNSWVSSTLDSRGIEDVLQANGMSTGGMGVQIEGMEIRLGLWKYCLTSMGQTKCEAAKADDTPDWMKGVQALGILTMLISAVAVVLIVYDILGQGKGDRARLLPYFIGGLCVAAGLMLVVAVALYGENFTAMMDDQVSMMGTADPALAPLAENLKEHTGLGWSFVLEAVSSVLMIIAAAVIALPVVRGCDDSLNLGSLNRAV